MNLKQMRDHYIQNEYSLFNATARVCQDVVLKKIAASSIKDNVAVKGGILMCALSGNARRATQDIDLDFIRYSISDESVRRFVQILSDVDDGVTISIEGNLKDLSHPDYNGKRADISISDGESIFRTKLDLGVHAKLDIEQNECFFDIALDDEGVYLLANPFEQAFAEKLKSLVRHGIRSSRFRDLYDIYYLGHREDYDDNRFLACVETLILDDPLMRENEMADIAGRIRRTLSDDGFQKKMEASHRDWTDTSAKEVSGWLIQFLSDR